MIGINKILKIVIVVFVGLLMVGNIWGQCTNSPVYFAIGNGDMLDKYPTDVSQYGYSSSVSESIYRYEELRDAGITSGEISSISYQCVTSPGNTRRLTIYMAHVNTYFSAWNYDTGHLHYVTTGLTKVVNARNVTWTTSGWCEINFDNNFTYQGGQDLLVVVIDHTQALAATSPQFKCHYTSLLSNTSVNLYLTAYHSYNTLSNVAGTPAETSFTPNWTSNCPSESRTDRRPNIRFKVSNTTCVNAPTNICYVEHSSSVDISWDANGASSWEVLYGPHGFTFPTSGTSVVVNENSCSIDGLSANTQYDFYVRAKCGSCNGQYTHAYVFVTLPSSVAACSHGIRIDVGDIDGYTGNLGQFTDDIIPFHTSYYYNYSQIIYTSEDLGISGGSIAGLTMNQMTGANISLGSPLKVFIGHTTKSGFDSNSDWIDHNSLMQVYSSSITLRDGLIYLPFSEPFVYNGTDNIVVAFYDTGTGTQTTSTTKAYYNRTASSDYRSLVYRSNSSFTPCANPATNRIQAYLSVAFDVCTPVSDLNLDGIRSSYCRGEEADDLPTSINGIEGTWSPSYVNTSILGSTDYTFIPNSPCISPATKPISVISCCTELAQPTLTVTNQTDRSVSISWNSVPHASSYILYYGVNDPNSNTSNVWSIQNATSPMTIPELTNGQPYNFAVMPVGSDPYCPENDLSPTRVGTPVCN